MTNFKMSWHDYKNYQFVCDGVVYQFCKSDRICKVGNSRFGLPIKHNILFLLNIHRGRFVSRSDILDFMYDDQDPDDWADNQNHIINIMILRIRKILPEGVKIICHYGFGYKLQIDKA